MLTALAGLALALTAGLLTGCGSKDSGVTTIKVSEVAHSVFYAPQ